MAIVRIPFLTLSPEAAPPSTHGQWSNGANVSHSTTGRLIADGLSLEFVRRQNAVLAAVRRDYVGLIGGVHHLLDPNTPLKRKLIWQSFMKIEHPATAGADFSAGFMGTELPANPLRLGVGFACQSNAQSWKARIADSADDVNTNVILNADSGISSAAMHFLKFTIDGETAKATFEIDGQVIAAHTMTAPLDKAGLLPTVPILRYVVSTVSAENHGIIFHGGGGVILYMEYESP